MTKWGLNLGSWTPRPGSAPQREKSQIKQSSSSPGAQTGKPTAQARQRKEPGWGTRKQGGVQELTGLLACSALLHWPSLFPDSHMETDTHLPPLSRSVSCSLAEFAHSTKLVCTPSVVLDSGNAEVSKAAKESALLWIIF